MRLSEKWLRRGLWLVSLVFASFLIGLGGTLVGDLPRVERPLAVDTFLANPAAAERLRAQLGSERAAADTAESALEQARLQLSKARSETRVQRESFNNWVATRSVTQRSEQDPEVIARNPCAGCADPRRAGPATRGGNPAASVAGCAPVAVQTNRQLDAMQADAHIQMDAEARKVELWVFLYRLALTLPLLVIAGWLFAKKRKGTYWPVVWGFIYFAMFAMFAFFVELVPYLPSYGGYVRYAVGIVVTVLVGRYATARDSSQIGLNPSPDQGVPQA